MIARPSTSNANSSSLRRRAFTVVEVTLSVFLLAIAMTTTVQILGLVAVQRRADERRQYAIQEVTNLMEHLTVEPWDHINSGSARTLAPSEELRRKLPEPELTIDVDEPAPGRGEKRLAIRLRWKTRAGTWDAPVRLTAWIARHGRAR